MAFQRKKAPNPPNDCPKLIPENPPKRVSNTNLGRREFLPSTLGNKNQQIWKNVCKTPPKTLERDKTTKTRVRSRKWISKTKPKKKRIFAKHFREQKIQQICKNIGKTPLKNTRRQQDNKNKGSLPKMDLKNQT